MKYFRINIILITIVFVLPGFAQKAPVTNYFASPLQIGLDVTGSFAEIRSNHFHSGIDFKTQKREGVPLLAVADGYISRIKVSPVGFGNALYIDHPNGFTSVYGHLQKYNNTISTYLFNKQYEKRSFAVDLFPARDQDTLWVRKGDIIGYSGNSGTSFGAHLHFEIRNTATERILNPFLFGLTNNDFYYPYFDLLKVYPMNDQSSIGRSAESVQYDVRETGPGQYRLSRTDTLSLWGNFAFGVQAFDYMYSREDRNGFYGIRMKLDNNLFFSMQCDSFAFDETKYINACIDYSANYKTGQRILRSNKLPGNAMSFFKTFNENGIVTLTDGKSHVLSVEVYDYKGNTSRLVVPLVSRKPDQIVSVAGYMDADTTCYIHWNKDAWLKYKGLQLTIPTGSLYDDAELTLRIDPPASGLYSPRYKIHTPETPLQKKITVSIDAAKVPPAYTDKALIVSINPKSAKRSSVGGKYTDGKISAEAGEFGVFAVAVDTTRPSIRMIQQKATQAGSLRFTVSDNLAGIADYYGEVNGKWALVEWDPKNRLMIYRFDNLLQQGTNTFKLEVKDAVGNTAIYTTSIAKK